MLRGTVFVVVLFVFVAVAPADDPVPAHEVHVLGAEERAPHDPHLVLEAKGTFKHGGWHSETGDAPATPIEVRKALEAATHVFLDVDPPKGPGAYHLEWKYRNHLFYAGGYGMVTAGVPTAELVLVRPGRDARDVGIDFRLEDPVPAGTRVRVHIQQAWASGAINGVFYPCEWHAKVTFTPDEVPDDCYATCFDDLYGAGGEKPARPRWPSTRWPQRRKITYKKGHVVVIRKAGGRVVPGIAGLQLAPGDRVKTSTGSMAELHLGDGCLVRMKQNTELTVPYAKEAKPRKIGFLQMVWGKIWVKVRPGNATCVSTPQAVAGVRGTEYLLGHEDGVSTLQVLDGAVDYAEPGMPHVTVKAGQIALLGGTRSGDVYDTPRPPDPWWQRFDDVEPFWEPFDALDEERWKTIAHGTPGAPAPRVQGGYLTLQDPGEKGFRLTGVTSREPALMLPREKKVVLEVTHPGAPYPEGTEAVVGLMTPSCLEGYAQEACSPWDWAYGLALRFRVDGVRVITLPRNTTVLFAPREQVERGARLLFQPSPGNTKMDLTLTDLDGTVLAQEQLHQSLRLGPRTAVHLTAFALGSPNGSPVEAHLGSVWVGTEDTLEARGAVALDPAAMPSPDAPAPGPTPPTSPAAVPDPTVTPPAAPLDPTPPPTVDTPDPTPDPLPVDDVVPDDEPLATFREAAPGETLEVRIRIETGMAPSAWVGLVPAATPRGSQAAADAADVAWTRRTGATVRLEVPVGLPFGEYELRLFPERPHVAEVARFPVRVRPPPGRLHLALTTAKPGEEVTVGFDAPRGFLQDAWIALVPAATKKDSQAAAGASYLDWRPLRGRTKGSVVFTIPSHVPAGAYEFRLFPSDRDRFAEVARARIRVVR